MSSKTSAVAVFDISSSSVAGAHALVGKNTQDKTIVTILAQERRDTGLEEEIDINRFINDTARSLEVVIDHIHTADIHHPEYIQVVLASPWYSTHTRTISYSKKTVFTCTKRLVDSLVEKEIQYFMKQPNANDEVFGTGFKVVEQQLSNITLNGYESNDPYGKKVQSIELLLTITVVPEVVVDRFSSIIRRSYGDRPISVTTSPYATYVALRDNGGVADDCVILDIGEEITDIAFVKNSMFLYQHSFPIGTYELYRAVSAVSGSKLEARALIEAYRLKKLTPTKARSIEKALQVFSDTWQQSLQQIVEAGHRGFIFPATCYIAADDRFHDFFTSIVSADRFLQQAASTTRIRTVFVEAFHTNAVVTTVNAETPDSALTMAILFIDRLL